MNTEITNKKAENQAAVISRLSMNDILIYEVHSNKLAPLISFAFGQNLIGSYIAWKVKRKYNRYLVSLEERNRFLNGL